MNKCAQCACLYVPDASERGAGREGVNPWLKAGSVSAKRRGHLPLSHPVRLGVARRLVNMVALANAAATLAVRPTAAPRHTRCVCAAACATARPVGCSVQGAATCCLLETRERGCSFFARCLTDALLPFMLFRLAALGSSRFAFAPAPATTWCRRRPSEVRDTRVERVGCQNAACPRERRLSARCALTRFDRTLNAP